MSQVTTVNQTALTPAADAHAIHERLRHFIAINFPLARNKTLADEQSLFQSGIIDSLGIMDLVGFVEEEFQILIADEDFLPENFETIARLTAFVQSKHNGN